AFRWNHPRIAAVVGLWMTMIVGAISCAPGNRQTPFAAEPMRFIIVGDTQQMPPVEWVSAGGEKERRLVRKKIEEIDPDSIIHAGDSVGEGFYKPYWKSFREKYGHLPIWPVIGNHDLHGSNKRALRFYFETYPKVDGKRWYSFRQAPILFLMSDSNFKQMSDVEIRQQHRWLDEALASADDDPDIRAVILVAHHPPFSSYDSGGNKTVQQRLWKPATTCRKLVAVLSGHHHAYQHILVGNRHAIVSGGGGAPLSPFPGKQLPDDAQLVAAFSSHHIVDAIVAKHGIQCVMRELQRDGSWLEREDFTIPWPMAASISSWEHGDGNDTTQFLNDKQLATRTDLPQRAEPYRPVYRIEEAGRSVAAKPNNPAVVNCRQQESATDEKIKKLIEQLGDDNSNVRNQSTEALIELGVPAL
ncbi:MAG: hypothetical protein A2Z34_09040, partial [Planctomycetes bacterium RBG_16_59_8]